MSADEITPPAPTVIALVASVGGVRAIDRTLEHLAPDLPAAVVVLLHQEPGRPEGSLRDLLARRSALPVAVAEDGALLRAGQVTVVPPGHHLLVTPERRQSLVVAGVFPPHRPSADLLLVTMATALGPDAVVVVMSGRGHDGATGATAIHGHGGLVLATSPQTSVASSMPVATIDRDDAIDAVVDLDDLPDELAARLGGADRGDG